MAEYPHLHRQQHRRRQVNRRRHLRRQTPTGTYVGTNVGTYTNVGRKITVGAFTYARPKVVMEVGLVDEAKRSQVLEVLALEVARS